MSRPNSKFWVIVPVMLIAVMAMACSSTGEEKTLLNKYFMASKINDNMTLQNIATIAFDPSTDGQMQGFSIVSVGEPMRVPLELKAKAAALRLVADEEKAFTEKKRKYQDDNTEAIDRILKAESKNQTIRGRDAEVKKEWDKFLEEQAEISKRLSAARREANAGRGIVEISCQDPQNPLDVSSYEGELVTKDVTVEGKVKPETGDAVSKTIVITLQQAVLKNVEGKDVTGRWVITGHKVQ